jgi:hypothetical protein
MAQFSSFGSMNRMPKPVQRKTQKPHPLIGAWVNGDEYETEVEYIVARVGKNFTVRAVDRFDGEEGEVQKVSYDDDTSTLSFAVHWNSTGRFMKIRLMAISPNRVSFTYTFTENQMWFRKGT